VTVLETASRLTEGDAVALAGRVIDTYFAFASDVAVRAALPRFMETITDAGPTDKTLIGYLVDCQVLHNSVPVWGDHVRVSVVGNQIAQLSVIYHRLAAASGDPGLGGAQTAQPLPFIATVEIAAPIFKSHLGIQSDYEVERAELCYVAVQDGAPLLLAEEADYTLAWQFYVSATAPPRDVWHSHGHQVWVDAVTGEYLGSMGCRGARR
jgi:hypothetical protein